MMGPGMIMVVGDCDDTEDENIVAKRQRLADYKTEDATSEDIKVLKDSSRSGVGTVLSECSSVPLVTTLIKDSINHLDITL